MNKKRLTLIDKLERIKDEQALFYHCRTHGFLDKEHVNYIVSWPKNPKCRLCRKYTEPISYTPINEVIEILENIKAEDKK